MNIYQVGLENRPFFKEYPAPSAQGGEFLLLYHLNTPTPDNARRVCAAYSTGPYQGASSRVLFVKGSPYGGLNSDDAKSLEIEYDHRIHFLSYAISDGEEPMPYEEKWNQFIEQVRRDDHVDWNLIDMDWPENLVAIYLLARAAERLQLATITQLFNTDTTLRELMIEATREYNMFTGAKLGAHGFDGKTPSEMASAIAECLRNRNPHAVR